MLEVDIPRKRISLSMRLGEVSKPIAKKAKGETKKATKQDLDNKLKELMNKFGRNNK